MEILKEAAEMLLNVVLAVAGVVAIIMVIASWASALEWTALRREQEHRVAASARAAMMEHAGALRTILIVLALATLPLWVLGKYQPINELWGLLAFVVCFFAVLSVVMVIERGLRRRRAGRR
jgi:hypothetical protein